MEPTGEPLVTNGLSLCKLHHAAFDRHFLTVRPDYVMEVSRSIFEEEDKERRRSASTPTRTPSLRR